MKAKFLLIGVFSLFLLLPACDEDTSGVADSGVNRVDGVSSGSGRDYVANKIFLPVTAADAKKYGYDIDKSGSIDNALGAVLMAIAAAAPGLNLQQDMDQNMLNGNVITLLRVTAKDFTDDPAAKVQSWAGKEKLCCAAKPCTETTAKTNCFSGTNEFEPVANSPANAVAAGAIKSGAFSFGPGTVEVQLPIGHWSARVKVLAAKVEGTISSDGIASGKLMGALSKSDIETQVIPAVAKQLDDTTKDPKASASTKAAIAKAFDGNTDGKITAAEVLANAAVAAVIAGDVDADGDGKAEEVSAGVGFTAVGCKIKTPTK